MQLSELGERICILGPSNSGKSTLADAIARKRRLPAIHLDQLFHLPDTDWCIRPEREFLSLHDQAIKAERWVIDGNYSRCMAQRFQRATGLIVLDVSMMSSLIRFFRRTWFDPRRIGALSGSRERIKMMMLHHIAVVTPRHRKRYRTIYRDSPLSKVYLPSMRAIDACYRGWELERTPW